MHGIDIDFGTAFEAVSTAVTSVSSQPIKRLACVRAQVMALLRLTPTLGALFTPRRARPGPGPHSLADSLRICTATGPPWLSSSRILP